MLKYYFGTMASGKSAILLMNVHQKRNNKVSCIILKPSEERDGDEVRSRIGLKAKCITFDIFEDLYELLKEVSEFIDEVYIDECQFLTDKQVEQLWFASRDFKLIINCFGLKNNYKNTLFTGISTMFAYADRFIQLEPSCTCKYCKEDATTHLLFINDRIVLDFPEKFEGDIAGSTRYENVCQRCYKEKIKELG